MMDILYYHYFLFYQKVLKEDDPHMEARFTLAASWGLLISPLTDLFCVRFFCYHLSKWQFLLICSTFLLYNYFVYNKNGRSIKVEKEKPMAFNSRKLSIVITILFFVTSCSSLLFGAMIVKKLLENC